MIFSLLLSGGGANVESQATYLADPALASGQQPGIAASALNNKALRQGTVPVSQLMQYIGEQSNTNVIDNGVTTQLLRQIYSVFQRVAPVVSRYTSSTGTWYPTYNFHCATFTISPTSGATYTDSNSTTFTVSVTATGVVVQATGSAVPAASGVLTKTGGTGDSTITYYAVRQPLYLTVEMVGGGGGGGSSGTASFGSSSAGNNSTFGTSLLTANGGAGGGQASPATGGAVTINSPAVELVGVVGGTSSGASFNASTAMNLVGGAGGTSGFGGNGGGGAYGQAGKDATANSGSGGGGGGGPASTTTSFYTGSGGGAGGYIKALIPLALGTTASYAYAVGSSGSGGTLGTNGFAGGNGAAGLVVVTAHYQ